MRDAARGYRFAREAVCVYRGNDLLKAATSRPAAAWQKTWRGDAEYVAAAAEAELAWYAQQGWEVVVRSGLAALGMVVVEGRADLVGAAPTRDEAAAAVRWGPLMRRLLGYDPPAGA